MEIRQNARATAISTQHHVNLRLERWHRWCLYICCGWLVITGLLFLVGHFFLRPVSEFGEAAHPLEPWSMRVHGAGAMVALFFFGSLMNSHIRRALKSGRNAFSGWTMIAVLAVLIITGYGLYYLAGESNRALWSTVHWIIGLVFPVAFILHIVFGRRSRLKRNH